MTEIKRDKLGRKIPVFDRKAAGKKGHETRKQIYGDDYNSRIGSMGGRKRTPGNFGHLKATNPEELKRITTIGAKEANRSKAAKRDGEERA